MAYALSNMRIIKRCLKGKFVTGHVLVFLIFSFYTNVFGQEKEKNGYIGFAIGPSFPISDFGDQSKKNVSSGYAEISSHDYRLDFGYRLGTHYGLSASYFVHQFDVDTSSTDLSWGLSGIVAGPMVIVPLSNKILCEVSFNFGYVGGVLSVDNELFDELSGHGLGIVLKGLIRYNILKRWCVIVETSYLTTNQRLKMGTTKNIQAINLSFGAGFRL